MPDKSLQSDNEGARAVEKELQPLQKHLTHLLRLNVNETALENQRNSYHRTLIVDSWSLFETCISAVCQHVIDPQRLHELLYGKIPKNPKKKITQLKHASFLTISRKTKELFDLAEYNSEKSLENDKRFLEFYGDFRNCMHNNYIYFGQKYEYEFDGKLYIFRNGESFKY